MNKKNILAKIDETTDNIRNENVNKLVEKELRRKLKKNRGFYGK